MIIRILVAAQTSEGTPLWQPVEVGSVSGETYGEARARLAELFYDLAHHDWSEDRGTESGSCGS